VNARAAILIGLSAFAGVAYAATRGTRNGPAERIDWASGSVDLPAIGWDFVDLGDAFVNQLTEQPANVDAGTAAGNIAAFLAALRASEGTDRAADPYRVVMGYGHTIADLSDHPYYTGEWMGAAFGDGQWSTAAGAYQFLRRTWSDLRDRLALPDFGQASQDAAAVELIRQRGALEDVKAGRFADAVQKVRRIWASLPGAGYGQGERSLAWLAEHYQANGGFLA
jgi:muramidase (phage lysozyme)